MKTLRIYIIAIVSTFYLAVANLASAQSEIPKVKGLHHVTINANNLDQLSQWYIENLGFESGQGLTFDLPGNVKLEIIRLNLEGFILSLAKRSDQLATIKKDQEYIGYRHLAYQVNDLNRLYQVLRERGVDFVSPPKINPIGKFKGAFLRDPEGNLIELYEPLQSLSEKKIEVFGQQLNYVEAGKGETLILLHGLGSNLNRWDANVDKLAKQYHVIALDQIGFGHSDKPVVPYRGATLVQFLEEFMNQKKIEQATLIGNSMGGWVASLFALTYPDRLDKLVLVDPAFLLGLPEDADADAIYRFANPSTIKDMEAYISRIFYQNEALLQPGNVREMLTNKLSWNDGSTVYQIVKSLIAGEDLLVDDLDKIRAETLIVHGQHDAIVPMETIKTLSESIPKNRVIIYDESGHSPMAEEPARFNKDLIDFLNNLRNEK